MNKTAKSLITKNDGIQIYRTSLFPPNSLNVAQVASILAEVKWSGDDAELQATLADFDIWYTFRLRELNGPTAGDLKQKRDALIKSLRSVVQNIKKFDRDMRVILAQKLKNERSRFKLQDLDDLCAKAEEFSNVLKDLKGPLANMKGGQSKQYRHEAAGRVMMMWKSITGRKFTNYQQLKEIEGSLNPEKDLQFEATNMKFMFKILRTYEPNLSVHDAKHAVQKAINLETQPK